VKVQLLGSLCINVTLRIDTIEERPNQGKAVYKLGPVLAIRTLNLIVGERHTLNMPDLGEMMSVKTSHAAGSVL